MYQRNYLYLKEHPDLVRFIRQHPIWYRNLTRDPASIAELEKEAKVYYGKTWPQRLKKLNQHVETAKFFVQLAHTMKD